MPIVLLDTSVWISLCDDRDNVVPRSRADEIAIEIEAHSIVLPWPICYEILRSSFVKSRKIMNRFENIAIRPETLFLPDTEYIREAFDDCLSNDHQKRPLSLVDCVLRRILRDPSTGIERFYTFDEGDFLDAIVWSRTVMVGKA